MIVELEYIHQTMAVLLKYIAKLCCDDNITYLEKWGGMALPGTHLCNLLQYSKNYYKLLNQPQWNAHVHTYIHTIRTLTNCAYIIVLYVYIPTVICCFACSSSIITCYLASPKQEIFW